MHTLHILAVQVDEAANPADLTALVEQAVDNNLDTGSWWDYYQIGGRWSGHFSTLEAAARCDLPSGDVLLVEQFPQVAIDALRRCKHSQDRAFREHRDHLAGAPVAVADLEGHVFGLPVAPDQSAADRMTALHQESSKGWQQILACTSLSEAVNLPFMQGGMAAYHVRRLIDLIDGRWCADSGYFDTVAQTSNPSTLLAALHGDAEARADYPDLSRVALVALDFHF